MHPTRAVCFFWSAITLVCTEGEAKLKVVEPACAWKKTEGRLARSTNKQTVNFKTIVGRDSCMAFTRPGLSFAPFNCLSAHAFCRLFLS